jgi:hypothetical protein
MNREEEINLDELTAEANASNVCKSQQQQNMTTSYLTKDMNNYGQAMSVENFDDLDRMMHEVNSNIVKPYEEPSKITNFNLQPFQLEQHINDSTTNTSTAMTNYGQAMSVEDVDDLDRMIHEANANIVKPYEEHSRIPHFNLKQFQFEAHVNDCLCDKDFFISYGFDWEEIEQNKILAANHFRCGVQKCFYSTKHKTAHGFHKNNFHSNPNFKYESRFKDILKVKSHETLGFNFLTGNVNGLATKLSLLTRHILNNPDIYDIQMYTESKITSDNPIQMPNYKQYHFFGPNNKTRGTSIFVLDGEINRVRVSSEEVKNHGLDLSSVYAKIIKVTKTSNNISHVIYVACPYIIPNATHSEHIEPLEKLFKYLWSLNAKCLIAGDFNTNIRVWLNDSPVYLFKNVTDSSNSVWLYNMIQSLANCYQFVNFRTNLKEHDFGVDNSNNQNVNNDNNDDQSFDFRFDKNIPNHIRGPLDLVFGNVYKMVSNIESRFKLGKPDSTDCHVAISFKVEFENQAKPIQIGPTLSQSSQINSRSSNGLATFNGMKLNFIYL